MLKKSNRLTTKRLLEVIKKGKVISSPLFVLRYVLNQPNTCISAVAPVKVAKTAVARNRARRRLYSVIRELFPSVISGVHVIIFSKSDLKDYKFETIRTALKDLLIKSKLMKAVNGD